MSDGRAYAAAGVDVNAGYDAVRLMKRHVESTYNDGVFGNLGGFGGCFVPNFAGMQKPVLVSGTDGVGTKLKVAFALGKHDTVGIDCVAMCVNDIICSGAQPLFFLDYIAQGKLIPERVEQIVSGIASGCLQSGCALIGGETAEMPGFYPDDEYDLAGFSVGMVDECRMFDSRSVTVGDPVIGIASSGVHSNGFSLLRKVFDGRLFEHSDELGKTIGEELLTPTRIYVSAILDEAVRGYIKSAAHITGGGFHENLPRMLPDDISLNIRTSAVQTPPIFNIARQYGNISAHDMYSIFNMGVGMALTVAPENADTVVNALSRNGFSASVIGECVENSGENRVNILC